MVDTLPRGPGFQRHIITVNGDCTDEDGVPIYEDVELWMRDPLECIQEILQNPAFKNSISYRPRRTYLDITEQKRVYSEMCTSDWWLQMQVRRVHSETTLLQVHNIDHFIDRPACRLGPRLFPSFSRPTKLTSRISLARKSLRGPSTSPSAIFTNLSVAKSPVTRQFFSAISQLARSAPFPTRLAPT